MYVSLRWLGRHIDLEGLTPEQICDDLTLSTAEVEGLERFAPHLSDVTVGFVKTRTAHPDADKLSVCSVDVGAGEDLTIVCGAPNVDAGQKVAVATVGTVLPGDFKIKKSKIRGVPSQGMICALDELGLGDDHAGIWVLPEHVEMGEPLARAMDLEDWVIEIDNKSLTHRPDLWGHRGIAGELAAIYRRELRPIDLSLPATGNGAGCRVTIESEACSRYGALEIEGARALPSPLWLQALLLAVGQRPIDQLVDLSNFVMLDLGQPNHTFDRGAVGDAGIVVRTARSGETIKTLDGEERKLVPTDLLICAGDTPVALAGIMGGEGSKISADTASLLLEVATFDPTVVRRTSSRLGLRTESSARFEKSLDPTLPAKAAAHFARLLGELQPDVKLPSAMTMAGEGRDPALQLELRTDVVRRALGVDIDDDEIRDILERLGFGVEAAQGHFVVKVPSARATKDVTIERDLVEEVGRIHRYGHIEPKRMVFELAPPERNDRRRLVRAIQDRLAGGARFHEVIAYSFVAESLIEKLGAADLPYVRVINPVVQGEERVRRSVLPSLLATLEANRRARDDVRLFEVGKGYLPEDANERGEPRERHLVGLVWAATKPDKQARFDAHRFSHLQGVVSELIEHLGFEAPAWSAPETAPAWTHPARRLVARFEGGDEDVALLADLDPGAARSLGLDGELESDVAVAEISIDALLAGPRKAARYRPLPKFPGIKVDVAVAVAEETPSGRVVEAIEASGKGIVAGIELFDLYRGESLGAGRKSLAYHVLLQSGSKTLSDKDQEKFLKRFEQAVQQLGGELRRG
jgi:phenylalanyl-tRNA synthetase beta chain